MNFLEAFEAPVVEKIGGIDISFPILSIDDYSPWVADLTAENKRIAKANLPRAVDPKTMLPTLMNPSAQWTISQRIEKIDCGLEDVAEKIWTLTGARRVLTMSMTKAALSDEDQKQILSRIKPVRLHSLAAEVSGLFTEAEEKKDTKPAEGQPDPNSSLGAPASQSASGGTGS